MTAPSGLIALPGDLSRTELLTAFRLMYLSRKIDDREVDAPRVHLGVVVAAVREQRDARLLEPRDVRAVVDDAHRVGLREAHADRVLSIRPPGRETATAPVSAAALSPAEVSRQRRACPLQGAISRSSARRRNTSAFAASGSKVASNRYR